MSGSKLDGVHPRLVAAVTRILHAAAELGWPMLVTDGVRTAAQQQALYAQGRTLPGKIVTKADGIRNRSNHQPHEDGFGHAVDMAWLVDGKVTWDGPWFLYGAMAKAQGLEWGGDWESILDRPHIELKDE